MLWNDTESQSNVTNNKKDTINILQYCMNLNTNKIELIKTIHTKKNIYFLKLKIFTYVKKKPINKQHC